MGLHLYCIAPASHTPRSIAEEPVTGIGGATVEALDAGDLSLWVSGHDARPDASLEAIKLHNNVVVAAMTPDITPVPMRFGQYFTDAVTARDSVVTSHEKWLELLHRFAGAVEFGLRVFDPDRPAEDTIAGEAGTRLTGSEYMAQLQRRQRAPERATADVTSALRTAMGGIVLEERIEALRTPHGVVSVAHLLHAAQLEAYHAAVAEVRARLPQLRLLSTGPWPPYSFVAE